jgi:hypothetical protein
MRKNSVRIQDMLINDTLLENEIRYLSTNLFELDDESKTILGKIAEQKGLNQYQLGMSLGGRTRRDTARRRISNLIKNGYVIEKKGKKTNAGTKTKQHELTLKGFLASSINTVTRDNYLMKEYQKYLIDLTDNRFRIVDLVILFVKYHLVLAMLWYKMMGFKLTSQTDLRRIFSKSITESILLGNYPLSELPQQEGNLFYLIGQEFQIIFLVIKQTITKLSKDHSLLSKINLISFKHSSYNQKKQSYPRIMMSWITDWAFYFEQEFTQPLDFKNQQYQEHGEGIMNRQLRWNAKQIKSSAEQLSFNLGLDSHHSENI